MKCYLYCADQIHYYNKGWVKNNCEQQHDVFVFDPESATFCCEMTPSYAMHPVYGAFVLSDRVKDPEDSSLLENIEEEIMNGQREQVMYVHQRVIDRCKKFKPNELPSKLPGHFVIEWDDDDDVEDIEEFCDYIQGNPPL